MGMTVVEKILARASGRGATRAGEVVEPAVDLAMSHENAALVINQFHEVFAGTGLEPRIWDPARIAIIFDHRVPAESPKTASNQKKVREFVAQHGIARFHDIRGDEGGICHQILPENGYIRPGGVVVGTDSHTTSHGALGAFSFGIGATEMASVWTLGTVLNVEVPGTIKVVVNGKFKPHVLPKDPFETIDTVGVGQLVRMATEEGRRSKPGLKVGVCGEHGGDPESVHFFHQVGLDYVSCSPFRVPVARVAAAQAAL